MKKGFALCLEILLFFSLVGCRNMIKETVSEIQDIMIDEGIPILETVPATEAVRTASSSHQSSESAGGGGISEYAVQEPIQIELEKEPEIPAFSENTSRFFSSAVDAKNFYQYSSLPKAERKAYREIVSAAESGRATVNVFPYGLSEETVYRIYQAVITDYPQFFYLSKTFLYTVSRTRGWVDTMILLYTDGDVVDQYNAGGKISEAADRTRIARQVKTFSERINELTAPVDVDCDVWTIEKQIHDLVIDTVSYDTVTAENAEALFNMTHAFDAYGAACEGKAVCEGYARLFQILCYRLGLNCTEVIGTAQGGSHIWNAIEIEGEWMMIDVTWDDAETADLRYYRYYNLTEEEMSQDHTTDKKSLSVPRCTSASGAFSLRFALKASSLSEPPDNYQEVLNRLAAGQDRYVCLFISESEQRMIKYMRSQIFSSRSALQKYIAANGYSIRFDGITYVREGYIYLHLAEN